MKQTHNLLLYEYERMKCLLLTLCLVLLLDSVLGSLPAPQNVAVNSVNLNHVLRWDPGPGTPPGTQYIVIKRVNGHEEGYSQNTTETSLPLELDYYTMYYLTVQASYNQTLSPKSRQIPFSPYKDTKIGPPKLSLAGCGDCIQVNISLPKKVDFIRWTFKVLLRKRNEPKPHRAVNTEQPKNLTLKNLEKGQEYCIQVEVVSFINKNTEPSAWTCTFTSIVEPRRVDFVLGVGGFLLTLAIIILFGFMFCLHYTGFLCKLETEPKALIATLVPGRILSLETTFPELISVIPATDKQNRSRNPTAPRPATTSSGEAEEVEEEEEEEEDEETNTYMDRGAGLSSGENSDQDIEGVSGNSRTTPAPVSLSAEAEEAHAEFDQYEVKDEGAWVSFMSERSQTQGQGHVRGQEEEEEEEEMKEKEEVCQTSGNIDLFSVTVAALAVSEEEEEEEEEEDMFTDSLKLSDREPLLLADLKRTLSRTDSDAESHDQTTVALTQTRLEKVKETDGYESRGAHSSSDETEEEEHSGYMGRA